MKYAYCHDRIVVQWWAEQVFCDLIQHNDHQGGQVRIFTLFSNLTQITLNGTIYPITTAIPVWLFKCIDRFRIHHIPFVSTLLDYRNLMILFPQLVHILSSKLASYQPDFMIVSSFAIIKNIVRPTCVWQSILYAHSPCMYVHNHYHHNIAKLSSVLRPLYAWAANRIRKRDASTPSYEYIYANSYYTARLIKELYGLDAQISYPRVHSKFLTQDLNQMIEYHPRMRDGKYCVMVGRLVRFSRHCDVVINLCNQLNIDLVVLGDGPDKDYLKNIGWPHIHFVGYVDDIDTKIAWMVHAHWLLNLTLESFGIGTAEALALGLPVRANHEGASPEFIGKGCGVCVDIEDKTQLADTLASFISKKWDRNMIRSHFLKIYNSHVYAPSLHLHKSIID